MEIMTRKEAMGRGETTYFTGGSCKNGHVAYRYVLNGACSECVKLANRPQHVDGYLTPSYFREITQTLIQFKSRVFDVDLDFFRTIVYNTAKLHEPTIRMRDLWSSKDSGVNRESGTALYRFNCFPADLEMLKETAIQMFKARCVQHVTPPVYVPPPSKEYWPEDDPK